MQPFIDDDFLLETKTARDLYHDFAKDQPIIDFHCHLSPELMADDHRFRSITEIWLEGDHYKWRAMRTNGVPERFCSGEASDWEKFEAWAAHGPRDPAATRSTTGRAMELRRPFGIETLLSPETARPIYEHANARLKEDGFTALGLLAQFKVAVVCSTDDPTDTLEPHRTLARREDPETRVYPTWRPDRAVLVEDHAAWLAWVQKLEQAAQASIGTLGRAARRSREAPRLLPRARLPRLRPRARGDRRGALRRRHGREARSTGCAPAGRSTPARRGVFRSALLHRLAILDHSAGLGAAVPPRAPCATTTRACARSSVPTPASTRSATSPRRGRWHASSTAWTRRASSPRRSSTT